LFFLYQQIDPRRVGYNVHHPTNPAKVPAYLAVEFSRSFCLAFEKPEGAVAVIGVASVIAVDQLRSSFPQVACSDLPIAHCADAWRARRPAIH
jgi:hypothetical protein